VAYQESELTYETVNPFTEFDRTPWTKYRPIAWPLPRQDSTTQRKTDICLDLDSNQPSLYLTAPTP